ncbi:MAG: hypothetical protein IPL53_24405 [Ignavibacteria bacterium]|nr:hypothetical protein [Ignavibacteria bacterium]
MKSFLLNSILILTIFSSAVNSNAQTTGNKSSDSVLAKEEVKNSLRQGQWALMFGIGSNFTLTNFEDAMIAGKYQFSSKSALRLDFNLDYYNEQDADEDFTDFQDRTYGGNLSFLYCINPKGRFNIYFTLGINYQYHYSFNGSSGTSAYSESTYWITGPKAGAGAEFFIFQSMSVFAEYNYLLGFGKQKFTQSDGFSIDSRNFNISRFRSDYAKFGLSVYF